MADALLRRWDRIGIGVRCAYNPDRPDVLRHYLDAGRQVVAGGLRSERQVQQRMLTVLLQAAQDAALPWYWRSVCLEHTTLPLARLRSALKATDPAACQAFDAAVHSAHEQLSAVVRPPAARKPGHAA